MKNPGHFSAAINNIAVLSFDLNLFAIAQPGSSRDVERHPDSQILAPFAYDHMSHSGRSFIVGIFWHIPTAVGKGNY
jgi:hypothetical protein